MEKKIVTKKKPKTQLKKEELTMKVVDFEATPECQTSDETAGEREGLTLKTKPKSKKRKVSYEEDVIDGFLMLSYASLEDLEADGPIKPGAILASNDDVTPIGIAPTKKKREGKSLFFKGGKGFLTDAQKKKKTEKTIKKPKVAKTDKAKTKAKKITQEDVATVTRPEEAPLAIRTEPENKPVELIKNASTKDVSVVPVTESKMVDAPTQVPFSVPLGNITNERSVSNVTMESEAAPSKENRKETYLPRKPLSDFSISAIQSMRGSAIVSPPTPTIKASTILSSAETQTQTKSIATMTSDQKQDKSISPMEVIMRKETGFQFRRFEETKISASIGSFSPSSSALKFDDTVIRKSLHHQIDLTDTSLTTNETSKLATATIKSREVLRRDSRSRSPNQHLENRPPSTKSLSSSKEATKHQHQHQHIHQHQHSHQHQHFHPPFGMVPNGVFPHSYYSGIPYLPPMPGSGPHTHLPKPISKPGKWCSLHVRIAHFIFKAQKEVERASHLNNEGINSSRPGLHAFQAVPSRSNYDRDFQFHSSVRPRLSVSPKAMHGGVLHSAFSRDPDRHSFHLQGRHHPYFVGRDSLATGHKRPDVEPPFSYGNLSTPINHAYRGLYDRERRSPPHLEAMFARRGSERTLSELEKSTRLLQHERSMLNMSFDRETHREAERHRHSSFLNRDKSAYFQPVKLDAQTHRSSLSSHGLCSTDITRKPSPRRMLSPLSSPLVNAQKPHMIGKELFERFHSDPLERRNLFGNETRLLGAEGRLFNPETRHFGAESRLLGNSEPRLFGSDKRLPTGDSTFFAGEPRKNVLPFGHNPQLNSSVSHAGVLGGLGRMGSKFTSSS